MSAQTLPDDPKEPNKCWRRHGRWLIYTLGITLSLLLGLWWLVNLTTSMIAADFQTQDAERARVLAELRIDVQALKVSAARTETSMESVKTSIARIEKKLEQP